MNKRFNHGIYAGLIRQYIAHKRSLGFKMEDIEERLRRFDRLTIVRGESSIGISQELFDQWVYILIEKGTTFQLKKVPVTNA